MQQPVAVTGGVSRRDTPGTVKRHRDLTRRRDCCSSCGEYHNTRHKTDDTFRTCNYAELRSVGEMCASGGCEDIDAGMPSVWLTMTELYRPSYRTASVDRSSRSFYDLRMQRLYCTLQDFGLRVVRALHQLRELFDRGGWQPKSFAGSVC